MSMPFYVPPEQAMREKAEFARKGISRGRSLVALQYDQGVVLVAENPSNNLRKISEIYDRIAFAGVGRFNEFDQLRQAGVRAADVQGYRYSRDDVEGRALANVLAQVIGNWFTHEPKPFEIEILIAEVGRNGNGDHLFHVTYDGTVIDETDYCVLGGDSDTVGGRMKDSFTHGLTLGDAVKAAVAALAGQDRTLQVDDLEVALLERGDHRRCFARLSDTEVAALIGS